MNTEKSKNFEEWLENAKQDEKFAYLLERLEQLSEIFRETMKELERSKADRALLLNLLQIHSHRADGKTLLPSEVVKFND